MAEPQDNAPPGFTSPMGPAFGPAFGPFHAALSSYVAALEADVKTAQAIPLRRTTSDTAVAAVLTKIAADVAALAAQVKSAGIA